MYRIIGLLAILWTSLAAIPAVAEDYTPDLIELDGSNGLYLMPHPNLSIPEQGTIEFWVVPDWTNDPGYDPVIVSSVGGQGVNYMIALLRDRDGLGIQAGDRSEVVDFDFTDGKLHHVAVNDYGDEIVVFVDAKIVGRFAGFSFENFNSAGIWIGSADGETAAFVGAIAAMRVWAYPIEQQDLLAYSASNLLTEQESDHPGTEYLRGLSDFRNREFLIVGE